MYRIGHSRDMHRFGNGRKLVLGTVEIPYKWGLVGHSDADCLVHAIVEALIGAMGLGDMGKHFPDTSKMYEGISSSYFLKEVHILLEKNNYQIVNIDSTILIENPMMAPYIPTMKKNIASILEIQESLINIKATRGEQMGFVGEGLGCEADCVVLIKEKSKIKKL